MSNLIMHKANTLDAMKQRAAAQVAGTLGRAVSEESKRLYNAGWDQTDITAILDEALRQCVSTDR